MVKNDRVIIESPDVSPPGSDRSERKDSDSDYGIEKLLDK